MAWADTARYNGALMRQSNIVALSLAALPCVAAAQTRTYNVTVIDSVLLHTVPTTTPISALVAKVPGGRVVASSHDPGTSPTIYLRGAMASVEGEPLVVLDGVPSSLSLADITTADVERIEIVNGAAGGATYGIRGGNGVVYITTRRPNRSSEQTPWLVTRSDVGQTVVPRRLPLSQRHAYQLDANGNFLLGTTGGRLPEPDGIQDNPYPSYSDLRGAIVRPRSVFSNYLSGGHELLNGRTRVTASASDDHDHGVLALLKGYSRSTGRVAIDQSVTPQFDVSVGAYGARSHDADAGFVSPFMQLNVIEPNVPRDSADSRNPYYMLDVSDVQSRRDRATWRIAAEYRPLPWLFVRASTSRDRLTERSSQAYPPSGLGDISRYTHGTERQSMSDASLGARRSFRQNAIRASARFTFADETHRVTGQEMLANEPPPDWPFPPSVNASSFLRRGRMQSYAFAATTDIGERISLDAHLRKDQAGWLVPTRRGLWYHRISGAYSVRGTTLHVAHGTAAPKVERTLETAPLILCPVMGPCGEPLRMPHARELEVGVKQSFRDRYDASYTFARQRTTDVPALAPIFAGTSLENVGTGVSVTHELTAGARLLSTPTLSWHLGVRAHRVRMKMTDMIYTGVFVGGTEQPIPFRLRNGETVGVMYGIRTIRTEAELLETLQTGQLTGTVADFMVNEEGYYVRTADWRTPRERPLTYSRCAPTTTTFCQIEFYNRIGDANPDVDLGIDTRVRWKAFTAYATVSAVIGGDILNRARESAFRAGRDVMFDQSARPPEERKPASYYYSFADGRHEIFVEDGTFVKLSELALDWRTPLRRETRIGIVARNLFTSSNYRGYDPDAAAGEPSMFGYRVDGSGHPAYRTVAVRVQFATGAN